MHYEIDDKVALELAASHQLPRRLKRLFSSRDYRPPALPAVALEVHRLSQTKEVGFTQIVAVVERDPMLAASLLRLVQSSYFATKVPPSSLEDAVSRLGLTTVRDLVWEVALRGRVFRVPDYQDVADSIRVHSAATAHIARFISTFTGFASEYAFLCGLLHDVGMAAALLAVGEDEQRSNRQKTASGRVISPFDLAGVFDELHQDLGGAVCQLWKLPMDIQLVVSNHHHPVIGGVVHPLAAAVTVAEFMATDFGMAVDFGAECQVDQTSEASLEVAFKALGLGAMEEKTIRKKIPELLERVGH